MTERLEEIHRLGPNCRNARLSYSCILYPISLYHCCFSTLVINHYSSG